MKTKKSPSIILDKVSKRYILCHEKPTFSEQILKRQKIESFDALTNISLTVNKGEKIGIIGSNGSGKTTLLKIITGITTPSTGSVKTFGRVVSLIDLEAGFHPELTGEENIFLNGMIIGMNKAEIKEKFLAIIELADIGNFIDSPMFTYSEGMRLRLGFSIALNANPDILILDEGVSVGDQNFQKKSSLKIQELFRAHKTVVIVTHWLDYLREHCTRIIWIDKGIYKKDGGIELLNEYEKEISKD
jgi:ABC-type polysaccharide/polyol phosphate transport system ATPase subunit